MAVCEYCNNEMLSGSSCLSTLVINGSRYQRIKYGDPNDLYPDIADKTSCPDCACLKGAYHHWLCDMERCPKCGNQLLMCDCDVYMDSGHMCTKVTDKES
jgi:hypothetical protein